MRMKAKLLGAGVISIAYDSLFKEPVEGAIQIQRICFRHLMFSPGNLAKRSRWLGRMLLLTDTVQSLKGCDC